MSWRDEWPCYAAILWLIVGGAIFQEYGVWLALLFVGLPALALAIWGYQMT